MVTHDILQFTTNQQFEVVDITAQVEELLHKHGWETGVVTVFVSHTTASIRINHYEPLLLQDISRALYRLVPQDISYNHDLFELRQQVKPDERSNGHAHVKALLLGASETLPVAQGRLALGDRQHIFLIDCDGGRKRTVQVVFVGETNK